MSVYGADGRLKTIYPGDRPMVYSAAGYPLNNMATDRILGREATGAGNVEELLLGLGLSLASGTLSLSLPHCLVTNSTTFSHNSSGSYLAPTWDTEVVDAPGFHSTSVNTARLTIPAGYGGTYIVVGGFLWDSNTTGVREIVLDHKDSSVVIKQRAGNLVPATASNRMISAAIFNAVETDFFAVFAYQDSGGTRTIDTTRVNGGFFGCVRVSS